MPLRGDKTGAYAVTARLVPFVAAAQLETFQDARYAFPMLLLVGGTGDLGTRIATRLAERGVRFRALARPGREPVALRRIAAELAEGDLRDEESIRRALRGCDGVVCTVTAMGRALSGERVSLADVDGRGVQGLIVAAEKADVRRFVFVSSAGINGKIARRCPLGAAKHAAEERLAGSRMRAVVVKPDMFMEVWLSASTGFDWRAGKVTIYGRGDAPAAYVATDDVAELTVRLTLAPAPPSSVEFGGQETASRNELVRLFERATGRKFAVKHVPRVALRIGALVLPRIRPHLASVMAMSLSADLEITPRRADVLRAAGIEPLGLVSYVERLTTGR